MKQVHLGLCKFTYHTTAALSTVQNPTENLFAQNLDIHVKGGQLEYWNVKDTPD